MKLIYINLVFCLAFFTSFSLIQDEIVNETRIKPDKLIEAIVKNIDSLDKRTIKHFSNNPSNYIFYNIYVQPKIAIIKDFLSKEDYLRYTNSSLYGETIVDSMELKQHLLFEKPKNIIFSSPVFNNHFVVEVYQTKHLRNYNCSKIVKGIRLYLLYKIVDDKYNLIYVSKKKAKNQCVFIDDIE